MLTPKRRERLYDEIRAKALSCCIAQASAEEIDRLNILQASLSVWEAQDFGGLAGLQFLKSHFRNDDVTNCNND